MKKWVGWECWEDTGKEVGTERRRGLRHTLRPFSKLKNYGSMSLEKSLDLQTEYNWNSTSGLWGSIFCCLQKQRNDRARGFYAASLLKIFEIISSCSTTAISGTCLLQGSGRGGGKVGVRVDGRRCLATSNAGRALGLLSLSALVTTGFNFSLFLKKCLRFVHF